MSILVGAVCVLIWLCWLVRETPVVKKKMITVVVKVATGEEETEREDELVFVKVDEDEDLDKPSMRLLGELDESLRRAVEAETEEEEEN